jgi:hypothetical protein
MLTYYQLQLLLNHKQEKKEYLEKCEKDLIFLTGIKERIAKDTTNQIETDDAEGYAQLNQAYTLVKIDIKKIKIEIKLVESVLSNQLKQYHVCLNILKQIMGGDLETVEEMAQSGNFTEMDYINIGKMAMTTLQVYEQMGNAQFNLIPRH